MFIHISNAFVKAALLTECTCYGIHYAPLVVHCSVKECTDPYRCRLGWSYQWDFTDLYQSWLWVSDILLIYSLPLVYGLPLLFVLGQYPLTLISTNISLSSNTTYLVMYGYKCNNRYPCIAFADMSIYRYRYTNPNVEKWHCMLD